MMAKRKQDPTFSFDSRLTGGTTPAAAQKNPVRRTDMIAAIVLVFVTVIVNIVVTALAVPLVLLTDSCDMTCNYNVIEGGFIFAVTVPSILLLIGIFVTIMRVAKRKLAFWVPLATIAAGILALVAGTAVMILGIPGARLF